MYAGRSQSKEEEKRNDEGSKQEQHSLQETASTSVENSSAISRNPANIRRFKSVERGRIKNAGDSMLRRPSIANDR